MAPSFPTWQSILFKKSLHVSQFWRRDEPLWPGSIIAALVTLFNAPYVLPHYLNEPSVGLWFFKWCPIEWENLGSPTKAPWVLLEPYDWIGQVVLDLAFLLVKEALFCLSPWWLVNLFLILLLPNIVYHLKRCQLSRFMKKLGVQEIVNIWYLSLMPFLPPFLTLEVRDPDLCIKT